MRARGALWVAAAVPVVVAGWLVAYGAGFFVPLVAAVAAFGTIVLYRWAAGAISRPGAAIALVAIAAGLALNFLATLVFDQLRGFAGAWDLSWWPALTSQEFGYFVLHRALFSAGLWSHYVPMMALATMFAALAALASFGALRLLGHAKER